jgi:hypothetical protein
LVQERLDTISCTTGAVTLSMCRVSTRTRRALGNIGARYGTDSIEQGRFQIGSCGKGNSDIEMESDVKGVASGDRGNGEESCGVSVRGKQRQAEYKLGLGLRSSDPQPLGAQTVVQSQ